jgi:3-phytase
MTAALGAVAVACSQLPGQARSIEESAAAPAPVYPIAETAPVASGDDAADDPAIWVHPRAPEKSLVLGTDKKRGLQLYDLDGKLLQSLPDGRLNNVDLRGGFRVRDREYALVAATNRSSRAISLYLLDP